MDWQDFLGGDGAMGKCHCGLCGNWGFIDTRGKVFTPAGQHCGILAWCICPNGKAWEKGGADLGQIAMRKYKANGF